MLDGGFDRLMFILKVYEIDRMEHHEVYAATILVLPFCEILASDVVLLAVAFELGATIVVFIRTEFESKES